MDLTEEKVSFDQMPTGVSELKQEISGLKTLVRTLIDAAGTAPKDAWMNIDELRAYHPDHPARPTIYEWVGKKSVPVHKDGKKASLPPLRDRRMAQRRPCQDPGRTSRPRGYDISLKERCAPTTQTEIRISRKPSTYCVTLSLPRCVIRERLYDQ